MLIPAGSVSFLLSVTGLLVMDLDQMQVKLVLTKL